MVAKASEPKAKGGSLYHIHLKKEEVGRVALLSGDPDRVPKIAKEFKDSRLLSSHREFTSYGGFIGKEFVVAISTGIGGPATAIAVEELARIGVKVFIRVGTCGAISRDLRVGSVFIADAAVRMEGTSGQYVIPGYPAAANPGVSLALSDAARSLGVNYEVGIAASTDSFYAGQGRESFGNYLPSDRSHLIQDLAQARVRAFEMEAAPLFTLSRIFGLKAGAACAVVANRVMNEFREGAGEKEVISVAIEGIRRFGKFGV